MMSGDARLITHRSDIVQHIEIIITPADKLCMYARIQNSRHASLSPDLGNVCLDEVLTEASDPAGWRIVSLWSDHDGCRTLAPVERK